jgi:hypothetical protein
LSFIILYFYIVLLIEDMDCTFELDFCGYTQLQDDEFNWDRIKGGTDTTHTGPGYDHTTGDGECSE